MKNQTYTGTPTSRRFALCPTTVKSGDFVLIGQQPAFAIDDYSSNTLGTTFMLNGTFNTTLNAWTGSSPLTGSQINPGDKIYANGGTLDTPTNVTTGAVLSKNSAGTLAGVLDVTDPAIASGLTQLGNLTIDMNT